MNTEIPSSTRPGGTLLDSLPAPHQTITRFASPDAKIALFASLFRGREDVYPRRFVSRKTGRGGYAPACANEWVRGLCEKPRIKCADCPNRRFLPITAEVIRWHLSGRDACGHDFVMGAYPMLLDETCHFLAADFDKESWAEDTAAFVETCSRLEIPVALERSRSGNGAHAWLFFTEAIPAVLARKLGAHLLTETLERRPDLGLRSYDRLFPNQDTLPKGGFGNLIALPLQRAARENGNSVFVDPQLRPYDDQWAFLASVKRLPPSDVGARVREAEGRGRIVGVRTVAAEDEDSVPWQNPPSRRIHESAIDGPLPDTLTLVLSDQIYVPKEALPPALRNRLVRLAAFQNPEFYRAQSMRLPTYDKPRIIGCAEDFPLYIGLPRGCLDELQETLGKLGIRTEIRDERCGSVPLEIRFRGELRPDQRAAVDAMMRFDIGTLSATTAFGKTVVAAWLIAQRAVNTLVLVHREQLMEQWIERLESFLELAPKTVGRLGGGRRKLGGKLDVALVQSLVRKGTVDDCVAGYGHLVVDECHHLSASSFESVARRARPRYVTGLSATLVRKDGHHPIIFMQCGPIRHRVDAKSQAASRPFSHHVVVRPTGFRTARAADIDQRIEYQELCGELMENPARNRMLCDDVVRAVEEGRSPLVLTERTDHLENLADQLRRRAMRVIMLQGGMGKKELRDATAEIRETDGAGKRVIVATGKFVGEGFDDPRLDTLFLAMPVSWRGTIAQYVGRLHRLHEGKCEVRVYDYADLDIPMLSRMFDRRCEGYAAVGYSILLPASAMPGWPTEVPLPIHPEWKREYSASVQRLLRDGVDSHLAGLFVIATEQSSGCDHTDRPRSASEAFLKRRLDTLQATDGRFRLNQYLPIPMDGFGRMEVDFLDAEAKLVIELDGDQHLGDAEAYRKDRRKDALLQEHGYYVLRFLARDLATQLDRVLDIILRALAHQRRIRAHFLSHNASVWPSAY